MKKRSLEETVELEKVRFDKRIKKLEEKRRKEEQRKVLREEKKILKEEHKKEKPKRDIPTKQIIYTAVIVVLLFCLILSVTTTFIFSNKFNKLDKKYDELKERNEKIMSIINTDDGTGDKILNLDKELETMKSDIEDLRVSRDTINDTVGNNANEINSLKAKVKNYDENAFRAVTGWLSYNQKLSNQYNNYQNQMYYVCERGYLTGKVPDGCPK